MTDREKQMIDAYLPHPRDPELDVDEYYVQDTAGRIQKVSVTDIFPDIVHDTTTYGVRRASDGKVIDAGYGDPFIGFSMGCMYDNKQDCRDRTHGVFDGWERLRELQQKEAEQCPRRRMQMEEQTT